MPKPLDMGDAILLAATKIADSIDGLAERVKEYTELIASVEEMEIDDETDSEYEETDERDDNDKRSNSRRKR